MITQPSYLLTVGVITLAASLAGLVFCLVVYQIGDIYRRNFLRDMDRGLQDIFLYMDPKQLFQALLLLLILIVPLSLYLLNLTITVFLVIAILAAAFSIPGRSTRAAAAYFGILNLCSEGRKKGYF